MRWTRRSRATDGPPPEGAGSGGAGAGRGQRTFLFGVGAQKAGTTWLYAYLRRSREFAHGYRKEYHVFDSCDLETEQWMRDRILGMAQDELDKAKRGEPADPEQLHRASMYADPTYYYDYFAGLLASKPRFRVAGDLTPDYALLSEDRYRDVKEQFAKRRVRTVTAFLMRDPVDRIYSQVRMQQGRRPARFDKPAEDVVGELFTEHKYTARSRYEDTLRNIDAVFDEDEVYYGFYETLFRESEVRRICDLIGIPFHDPDFGERRNASQQKSTSGLPESVERDVAVHLQETYRAVAARFPDQDLTEIWPSARHVL